MATATSALAGALAIAGLLVSDASAQTTARVPPSLDVVHYEATVDPDIERQTLRGTVSITFNGLSDTGRVMFDSGSLIVDSVREGGEARPFEQKERHLIVALEGGTTTRTLIVSYHGSPKRGLLFRASPPQAFTIFTTSEWMPCVDAPGDKATLDLTVIAPPSFAVAGNGRRVATRVLPDGRAASEWRNDRPMPSYTFGFATGAFAETTGQAGAISLRSLGVGLSVDELQTLFGDTADAMAFFADRAGIAYPGESYTEVLAGNGIGQEAAGFSVFPESYGRELLSNNSGSTLGLHELAHQWWGNLVTCADWRHFWLNEGFATFMTAAYLEGKSGRAEYDRLVKFWKTRYERLIDDGHDKPLVFSDWDRPTADDRSVVYSKGVFVLSLLREAMGDAAFWKGLRAYTTTFAGGSVVTADFIRTMEESSGQNLRSFADRWVYSPKP